MDENIAVVRKFNRFMTRQIGVLNEGLLNSEHSPTEARLLFEIAQHQPLTNSELSEELHMDMGYLSRLLTKLEEKGLVSKMQSETDRRSRHIHLTPQGEKAFEVLNEHSDSEIAEMLNGMAPDDQKRLLKAMKTIESILGETEKTREPYLLRTHESGDMGWIVYRHGVLYANEYRWDERFEALVARIVSDFINQLDPNQERCWIAEKDGDIVGSVFLVKADRKVAKLRLLYVEPEARGFGIGTRLVDECIRFARRKGYQKLVLWTNSVLKDARRLYESAGFQLAAKEEHHSFGHDLVGETWEMNL